MRRAVFHGDIRAAQLFRLQILLHFGRKHLRSGNQQRTGRLGHDHHVRQLCHQSRRADARTENHRHHRHNAAQTSHVRKHIRIGFQSRSTFAHARAVAVAHRDDRRTGLARQFQHLNNLLCLLCAHCAVHHGEILRKDIHRTAVHRAGASYDAGIVCEHALLDKTAAVQQHRNALTRSLLAALLLFLNARGILIENSLLA